MSKKHTHYHWRLYSTAQDYINHYVDHMHQNNHSTLHSTSSIMSICLSHVAIVTNVHMQVNIHLSHTCMHMCICAEITQLNIYDTFTLVTSMIM